MEGCPDRGSPRWSWIEPFRGLLLLLPLLLMIYQDLGRKGGGPGEMWNNVRGTCDEAIQITELAGERRGSSRSAMVARFPI